MTGKEFAHWMDSNRVSNAEAASIFGVSEQNIYNWRSTRGIPRTKLDWVHEKMRERDSADSSQPFLPRQPRPGFFEIFPDDLSLHRADRASRIAGADSLASWCHDVIMNTTDAVLDRQKKPVTYLKKVVEPDSNLEP